jgi:hypothetical protein
LIRDVEATTTLGTPHTGGGRIYLSDFGNVQGRDVEFRKLSFTADPSLHFYDLFNNGPTSVLLENNGYYYWEGSKTFPRTYNLKTSISKQSCSFGGSCSCDDINFSVDLSDWIVWDKTTNKQISLSGVDTINVSYESMNDCGE